MEEINVFTSGPGCDFCPVTAEYAAGIVGTGATIAHIGSWSLDVKTRTISWSNELFPDL
jgi:hypothetical protein